MNAFSVSRDRGFTLFEIIIVLFILSLIVSLSLPAFTVLTEKSVEGEAKRLASIVRYLNDGAVSRKRTFTLTVDFESGSVRYSGPDGEKGQQFRHIYSAELQSRGAVSDGELTIIFSPLGASEAFSFLMKDDASSLSVSFNPLSGRVKIEGERA